MVLQQIINGLTLGIIYALVAVGFSLVFGILRLINFSHGSVYAFGAHISMVLLGFQFGLLPALLGSLAITGLLGVAIDKIGLEPLRKKKSKGMSALITTIGISYIIQNFLMIAFGSQTKYFPKLFDYGNVTVAGTLVGIRQFVIFGVALVLLAILTYVVNGTKIGLAMRAIEQNQKAAHLMGVKVNSVITFTFFLGGASAAIAGTLIAGYYQMVYPTMGFMVGLKAFAAAVLGGIGILYGSILGGLFIGVSETFAATYLGGSYRDAIAFLILIIVLLIRPAGLFGKKTITKV
ncbi:MAG: branched-chain amino acid transport system permease protein [Spirochaetes bacterium]|nr:MAG: branched-chain amino acid transport system permease protein [Spirochaetota bacterium]